MAHLRSTWIDLGYGLAVAGAGLWLYLRTLAPSVMPSDISEYQFVLHDLGIPHPTGYPLYVIVGHLWSRLPIGSVAYRLNLLSAVFAAAALVVLYGCLRRVTERRFLAWALTLYFAVTPTFWSQALIAGTYTLHTLLFAVLLLLVMHAEQGRLRLEWVLAAFGLGLAHHRTTILIAPALAYLLWHQRRAHRGVRGAARLLLAGTAPLALYLYFPLRATALQAPELRTVQGFLDYVSGRAFSYLLFQGGSSGIPGQMVRWWEWLLREVTAPGALVALVGLAALLTRWRRLGIFTLITYLAFLLFNWNYAIGNIWVYYLPTYVLLVVWMAAALDWGLGRIERAVAAKPWVSRGAPSVAGAALLAGALLRGAGQYAVLDASQDYYYENLWLDALALPLPRGAAVLANWDAHTPLVYYQRVEARRPDLRALIVSDDSLRRALAEDTVAYALTLPPSGSAYALSAFGPLFEVRARPMDQRQAAVPHPMQAVFGDCLQLHGYDFRYLRRDARGAERYHVSLFWSRAATGDCAPAISLRLSAEPTGRLAQVDGAPVHGAYPPSRWAEAEVVRDGLTFVLPPGAQPRPAAAELALVVYWPDTLEPMPVEATGATELTLGLVSLAPPPNE